MRVATRALPVPLRNFLLRVAEYVLGVILVLASRGCTRAWSRNSLRLGYASERSDLDLTVVARADPCEREAAFCRAYNGVGMGEAALYSETDREWAFLANPFEASRDPLLARKFGMAGVEQASRAQAIVFFLRMAGSDPYLHEPRWIETRARKWRHHLAWIGGATGTDPGEFDSGAAIERFFPVLLPEFGRSDFHYRSEEHERFACLHPHRWLADARPLGIVLRPMEGRGAPILREVQVEQIKWEMWGLTGQIRLNENPESVVEHLAVLFGLLTEQERVALRTGDFLAHLRRAAVPRSVPV